MLFEALPTPNPAAVAPDIAASHPAQLLTVKGVILKARTYINMSTSMPNRTQYEMGRAATLWTLSIQSSSRLMLELDRINIGLRSTANEALPCIGRHFPEGIYVRAWNELCSEFARHGVSWSLESVQSYLT